MEINKKSIDDIEWEVPSYSIEEYKSKMSNICVCIPVINEGERIQAQLSKMFELGIHRKIDIIICDGGSSDGSVNEEFLKNQNIRVLLTKMGKGKLSSQLRMGYSYALKQEYKGIITIDGNNKDNVEAIFDIANALNEGYDMIQGSRYIKGGKEINTPLLRKLAVKLIHIPIISILSGFKYTDTTNGFRGYSSKFLLDSKVKPFRNIFDTYELLAYLSVKAPKLGYKVKETPVTRKYPSKGKVPTKISFFKGNFKLIKILIDLLMGRYDVN